MTKTEAIRVVSDLLKMSRIVFVSVPIVQPQEEYDQNPFERHIRDDWTHAEIQNSFPGLFCGYVEGHIGVYILSDSPRFLGLWTKEMLVHTS